MADDCCASKTAELERLARRADQRRVLRTALAINAVMFGVEFGAGLVAGSAALMADSVDMFGDAAVYGLSLYALARSDRWKAGAALAKAVFMLLLGAAVAVDIAIKLRSGVPPSSTLMLAVSVIALAANLLCFRLLWRFRSQDLNMASTFECSQNDIMANAGVFVAAILVAWLVSPWPDIVVGAIIAALFLRSALRVAGAALPELRAA